MGICKCGEPVARSIVKATSKSVEAAAKCSACGLKLAIKSPK